MSRADDGDDTTATGARPPPGATSVTVIDKPPGRERSPTGAVEVLPPATRVDRFVILDKVGEGGMGVVYSAYDTLLDRKVAMKVVRADRRTARAGALSPRDRLLREAQAMARLHHPNVVAVLDVGERGDDIYLALELVEGKTLKAWLRETRRPWRAVLAAFIEAGRGLAASHAAGLVHRDVKPDNILVGKDGRIRVTDFGVVSLHHPRSDNIEPDAHSDGGSDEDTLSGLRVGTPAYMAPEQFEARPVDARADQFSFCVALWEALFGERPFAPAKSEIPFARRPIREVPRDSDVPGWLVAAVRRGLTIDVNARWPSMDALLDELTRDRSRRRRLVLAGFAAIALVASAVLAFVGWTRGRDTAALLCKDETRHLAGVWDVARADALAAKLRASTATHGSERPAVEAVVQRVRDHLDAWTREWVTQRTAACAATRIHGDQSEAMLDVRMRCLDRRLVRVHELIHELERIDPRRAIELTSDLPDLRACSDSEQLTAAAPAPADPVLRGRVEAIEDELARVVAIELAGRYPAALALAVPLVAQAAATRHAPVHAEAMAAVGRLRAQTGEHAAGIAALREAAMLAAKSHADDVAASALVELVWATANAGRGTEALAVAAAVGPLVARVRVPTLEVLLAAQVGDAYFVSGDLAAATTVLERALALGEATLGPDHVRVAQVLNRLGAIEDRKSRHAEARTYYSRALAIVEAKLGSEHPSTAITRANLCYLDSLGDRLTEATECYARVIETLEAALGSDHPQVAWALNDAGLAEQARGRLAQARAAWERALAIYEKLSNGEHPDTAWPLINLGGLAITEGDDARGEALCRRALRLIEAAGGSDQGATFQPLICVGVALAERRPVDAVTALEQALRLDEAKHDPAARGTAHFALARASIASGDRARARKNAHAALAAFDEAGTSANHDRAQLAEWMEKQRVPRLRAAP